MKLVVLALVLVGALAIEHAGDDRSSVLKAIRRDEKALHRDIRSLKVALNHRFPSKSKDAKKEGDAKKDKCKGEQTALVIIDMQKDFCSTGGSLLVPTCPATIEGIVKLKKTIAKPNVVVQTKDWHPAGHMSWASSNVASSPTCVPFTCCERANNAVHAGPVCDCASCQMMWPDHCAQKSPGAEIVPQLWKSTDKDLIVLKGEKLDVDSYSGFFDNDGKSQTELDNVLSKHCVKHLVVVGTAFDYCVGSTAIDGKKKYADKYKTVTVIKDLTSSVAPATDALMMKRLEDAGVIVQTLEEYEKSKKTKKNKKTKVNPGLKPFFELGAGLLKGAAALKNKVKKTFKKAKNNVKNTIEEVEDQIDDAAGKVEKEVKKAKKEVKKATDL